MNSITATALPKRSIAKHFVAFLLATMLCMTALEGDANAILNASGLLVLVWPISMFIYAWLSADVDSSEFPNTTSDRLMAYY